MVLCRTDGGGDGYELRGVRAVVQTARWVQHWLRRGLRWCAPWYAARSTLPRRPTLTSSRRRLCLTDAQPTSCGTCECDINGTNTYDDMNGNTNNINSSSRNDDAFKEACEAACNRTNLPSCDNRVEESITHGKHVGSGDAVADMCNAAESLPQSQNVPSGEGACAAGGDWLSEPEATGLLPSPPAAPRWIAHTLRHHLGWRLRAIRTATAIPIAHVSCLGYLEWCGASPVIAMAVAEEVSYVLR